MNNIIIIIKDKYRLHYHILIINLISIFKNHNKIINKIILNNIKIHLHNITEINISVIL